MNVNAISLQNLLYKSTCVPLAIKAVDNKTADYLFRINLKGVRSNSPLGRNWTDSIVLAVRASGREVIDYCDVSSEPTGKALWSLICQCLKRELLDAYVGTLYDIVHDHAARRGMLGYNGCIVPGYKEELCA